MGDVGRLWAELHRVVSHHPLVRASRSAGLLVEEGTAAGGGGRHSGAYTDLTQELFVVLLSKGRFRHYLETGMTDQEIECEVSQIELTNLLTAELRKRHPESYRLARRISTLIQAGANFRRFDAQQGGSEQELGEAGGGAAGAPPLRRLAERVYGLSEWPEGKPRRGAQELERRVRMVGVRHRDTRMVGCTGDSQVIITNSDLEELIVSVLEACDSPVDVRTLRGLVMSRLPVMDIYLVPLGGGAGEEEGGAGDGFSGRGWFEPADGGEDPERGLLRRESEREAEGEVEGFLEGLRRAVRGKARQYERMLGVLWHCYLSEEQATQLEVAASLGVSDSLISNCRHRIERLLRGLSFSELEEARSFEAALRLKVHALLDIK